MPSEINAVKGDPAANSYATILEFNRYFEDTFGADDYWGINLHDKVRLLITATRMIDRLTASYPKKEAGQSLIFPMSKIMPDGYENAKEACIMQAFYLFRHHETLVDAANSAIQGVTSESTAGSGKSFSGFNWIKKWSPDALHLLIAYIEIVPKLYRG